MPFEEAKRAVSSLRWIKMMDNFMKTPINMKKEGEGIFFVKGPLVKIGDVEINFLKEAAHHNGRKSARLCTHGDITDLVQEMLILHSKETYVHPHKHPAKSVSYHIIEGIADMVLFDEQGEIRDVMPIGKFGTGSTSFFRLNEEVYYLPLVRSDFLLFHETIKGPFKPSATIYAPWAPDGDDPVEVERFRKGLTLKISKFRKPSLV